MISDPKAEACSVVACMTMRNVLLILFVSLFICVNVQAEEPKDDWKDVVSIKAVDSKPVPVKQEPPVVPASLQGTPGVIHVAFIIDEKGNVPSAKVIKSTNEALNQIAIDSVTKWKFKPAMNVGVAIPVRAIVPLRFK